MNSICMFSHWIQIRFLMHSGLSYELRWIIKHSIIKVDHSKVSPRTIKLSMIYVLSGLSYFFFSRLSCENFLWLLFFFFSVQAKTSLLLLKILTMGLFCAVIWQRFFLSRRFGLVFRKTEIFLFLLLLNFGILLTFLMST